MVYNTRRQRSGGVPSVTIFVSPLLVTSLLIRQGYAVVGDNFAGAVAPAKGPPKASLQTHVNNHDNDGAVDVNIDVSTIDKARAGAVAEQGGMVDFSFSHVALDCLPAPAEFDDNSEGDDNIVQSSHSISLSLRECSLGDAGVSELALSPWIFGEMAARALSLRHNQITASGARALFEALRSSSADRLSCLQLDFNPLGNAGVQPLPAYLKQRAAREGGGLEELSLRFCGIGPPGCRYISSALAKSAASTAGNNDSESESRAEPHGRQILPDASGKASSREGARKRDMPQAAAEKTVDGELSPADHPAHGIRRLLLTGNRLGDGGAKALASALEKDRSVEVLDLTRCRIGDEGVRCLADALRSNTRLRELRLGYNEISADGASNLATLLRSNRGALETLELQGNHIGDDGAVALARGLAARRTKAPVAGYRQRGLRRLNLSGNRIGCVGGCALAKALYGSGRKVVLEELELSGNPLTLSAARAAEASKNPSYLYKSAGGALSSLLNQFVDDSYYRPDDPSSPPGGIGERDGGPLRCAIAAFGTSLRHEASSLKALGLARTGVTEGDALRLAAALRGRRVAESSLDKVEVGMNGLGVDAMEAVRLAVESPTGANCLSDADEYQGFAEGRRSHQARGRGYDGRGRGARSPRSRMAASNRRENYDDDVNDEWAVRGEVEKYAPVGGDVELELFGRKVASFRQTRVARSSLDMQVFGKQVRLESPSMTKASPNRYKKGAVTPRTGDVAVVEDGSDDEDWSDNGDDSEVDKFCYYNDVGHADSDLDAEEEEEEDDGGEEEESDDEGEDKGEGGDDGEVEKGPYFDMGHSNIDPVPDVGRVDSNPWSEVEEDEKGEDTGVGSDSRDTDGARRSFPGSSRRGRLEREATREGKRQKGSDRLPADQGAADGLAAGKIDPGLHRLTETSASTGARTASKRDAGVERALQARKEQRLL